MAPASAPELGWLQRLLARPDSWLGGAPAAAQEGGASPRVLLSPRDRPLSPAGRCSLDRLRDGYPEASPTEGLPPSSAPAQETARFLRARAKGPNAASPGGWEVCFFADCSQIELREEGETPPWGPSWGGSGLSASPPGAQPVRAPPEREGGL